MKSRLTLGNTFKKTNLKFGNTLKEESHFTLGLEHARVTLCSRARKKKKRHFAVGEHAKRRVQSLWRQFLDF